MFFTDTRSEKCVRVVCHMTVGSATIPSFCLFCKEYDTPLEELLRLRQKAQEERQKQSDNNSSK